MNLNLSPLSPNYIFELPLSDVFEVDIVNFEAPKGIPNAEDQFCWAFPSYIDPNYEWYADFWEEDADLYEAIATYKGWYFLLNSDTLTILASRDLGEEEEWVMINSTISTLEDEFWPYLLVDEPNGFLYVITSKKFLSYKISDMLTAVNLKAVPPSLSQNAFPTFKGYNELISAKIYNSHLFVAGDENIEVFTLDNTGNAKLMSAFNMETIGVQDWDLADISFYNNFMFILDWVSGIYTIDISNLNSLKPVPSMKVNLESGVSMVTIKSSLSVLVLDEEDFATLYEYFIVKNQSGAYNLVLNREVELDQGDGELFTDGNLLYILSGYQSLVLKNSIPGNFETDDIEYYSSDWLGYVAQAMIAVPGDGYSEVIIVTEYYIQGFFMEFNSPQMYCETEGVPLGQYNFRIKGTTTNCPAKSLASDTSAYSVCQFNENIVVNIELKPTGSSNGGSTGTSSNTNDNQVANLEAKISSLNLENQEMNLENSKLNKKIAQMNKMQSDLQSKVANLEGLNYQGSNTNGEVSSLKEENQRLKDDLAIVSSLFYLTIAIMSLVVLILMLLSRRYLKRYKKLEDEIQLVRDPRGAHEHMSED